MMPLVKLRKRAGKAVIQGFFRGASRLGSLHPRANPDRHGIEVVRDVAYLPTGKGEHRLDIWRPKDRTGPLPALLYVHGGGFTILSKETHWPMALSFARRGFCVFNINYRLAPQHRYPAALADVCAAYVWLAKHAHEWGADLSQLVVAGESAGANLVTALTVAACFERAEPDARAVFATGLVPRVTLPACGILQVTDIGRIRQRKPKVNTFVNDRLHEVALSYLDDPPHAGVDLADPLLVLESEQPPARPLPPFFAGVGTADALLDDTRRLGAALEKRGVPVQTRYYPGEVHAFHALLFRPHAKQFWRDQFAFLEQHLPGAMRPADDL
jgi:acetyl esterase